MNERAKGPEGPHEWMKRDLRTLMKHYNDPRLVGQPGANDIISILGDCFGAAKNNSTRSWPKRFHFSNKYVPLFRITDSGETEVSERPVRVPDSPIEFVQLLKDFNTNGVLPPETDAERAERTASAHTTQNEGSHGGFREWAKEHMRREDDAPDSDYEPKKETRSARWRRWREGRRNAREEKREERAHEKEQKRSAAEEAEANRPINVIRKRIATAMDTEDLKKIFHEVLSDKTFADHADMSTLSPQGENLIERLYAKAIELFKAKIPAIKSEREMKDIKKEMDAFFGGTFTNACAAEAYKEKIAGKRLSNWDRAQLTDEQQALYERNDGREFPIKTMKATTRSEEVRERFIRELIFPGPFSEDALETMHSQGGVEYRGVPSIDVERAFFELARTFNTKEKELRSERIAREDAEDAARS